MNPLHLSMTALEAGLPHIQASPRSEGRIDMIVRRPDVDGREVIEEGILSLADGLVGDSWRQRPSSRTPTKAAHPDCQLTLMNTRVIALIAQERDRWPLAGDQIFVDLDLSDENLPAGTRLALGSGIVEVTDQPHTGCRKFVARFGLDAMQFVNSPTGRALNLRGINTRVLQAGVIKTGDVVRKLAPESSADIPA